MKFEDLLSEINGFGRFQKMVLCINFVGRLSIACHFLLGNFIAVIPSHHCSISSLDADEIFANLTQEERLTVSIPVQEDGTLASCHMFSHPQFHLLSNSSSPSEVAVVQCQNGWEYDNSTFISTLATQWDLVCDKKTMSRLTTTIFFIGVMFGADVEWVSIEHRKLVGVIESLAWTFGFVSFPLFAYLIRDWQWLTVAISLPTVIAIITWWWVPESARWLIASGRVDKAHYYLQKCAVMNHKKDVFARIKPEFVYGAIEIPAKLSIYYMLEKFGRRITQSGSLMFVGISLMINIFIPKDKSVARTVIAVLGKGCSATSFGTVILYTSELYPTVVRQNGVGYTSFLARLGVSVAPLILLSDDIWSHFSQVILSSLGLSAAFVAYLLPETRGRCLPETIEDIEGISKGTDGSPLQDQKKDEEDGSMLKLKDNLIVQNN
ncbi:solute carrier family 22 member 7-like protein [Labeo rohita]|uniref:Solute carrier family 22 member 7-like protein n=1 Tax=Labeo rohita TaxID=84645 RepID=A0A498NBH3_LABRO|nr:solute carrier family 22 member 7-like protein [Labeo rohita]